MRSRYTLRSSSPSNRNPTIDFLRKWNSYDRISTIKKNWHNKILKILRRKAYFSGKVSGKRPKRHENKQIPFEDCSISIQFKKICEVENWRKFFSVIHPYFIFSFPSVLHRNKRDSSTFCKIGSKILDFSISQNFLVNPFPFVIRKIKALSSWLYLLLSAHLVVLKPRSIHGFCKQLIDN